VLYRSRATRHLPYRRSIKAVTLPVGRFGPSNLFTLLATIPPYWEAIKKQLYRRMGDPGTPESQALLKERSPLNFAANIERPLLIGQGANDPRVNAAESDQIVDAMTENFLARCLDGRAEGMGDTLKPSTAPSSRRG